MTDKEKLAAEIALFDIFANHQKQVLFVWNVRYADKNGEIHKVQYCTSTKEEAARLFRSEQDNGDVIKSIRKARTK